MHRIRHAFTWAAPILMYAIVSAAFTAPANTYYLFGLAVAVIFFALMALNTASVARLEFWNVSAAPLTFLVSSLAFITFLDNYAVRAWLLAVAAFFIFLYLHQLFLLHYHPSKYQPFSLESISSYLNLISIFCASVVSYGLLVFLSIPIWAVSLLLIGLFTSITYQGFWIQKIDHHAQLIYTIVLDIIFVQLFWALAFLPIHFYVDGALLTLAYYVLWGMIKARARDMLSRAVLVRYIAIGAVLAALVIGTAPWM